MYRKEIAMPKSKIKSYPHFDPRVTEAQALELASDPSRVEKHAFYPFLQFDQHWTKYPAKGVPGKAKSRLICYASRRDAFIFSHYREKLNERYEDELRILGLTKAVIAYRRIPNPTGKGNKCNIQFALEAFQRVKEIGDCYVFALDIEGFFAHLEHEHLRKLWGRMIGADRLPKDQFQVFKAVTKYAWVDKIVAYTELGHIGPKLSPQGKQEIGYRVQKKDFPTRICSAKEFRQLLSGKIEQNKKPYGIPQGSPISDVLANLYLIDFDQEMESIASARGGHYFRYSDDILLILPRKEEAYSTILSVVEATLKSKGPGLKFKPEKTQVYQYLAKPDVSGQEFVLLHGSHGKNGLEYLGFRFDGSTVYLRDSTISGIHRKITATSKSMARRHVERHPSLSLPKLKEAFNFGRLTEKFGRVENFEKFAAEYKHWTFWTYAKRSSEIFGSLGTPISRQLRNFRQFVRSKAINGIDDAYRRKAALPNIAQTIVSKPQP
jgi:hypothetical protein